MSSSNYCFLTCIQISQEESQVVCYSHLFKNFPQFFVVHIVKGFGIVNKAEVDVFLELSCFFDDPTDVANLISGSSAFSKTSLNIWKFVVHILLKPGLENFEHYFTGMWDECNCAVVWAFFGIAFLCDWNENWLFQSCGHCWVSQIFWHIECIIFIASSFRIWTRSTGIPSPPLAFFIVILPKALLTLHSNPKERQCQRMLKLPHNCTHLTCQQSIAQNSRKTSTSASLTTSKLLTVWITTNCGKFFKRWKYQNTLPAS